MDSSGLLHSMTTYPCCHMLHLQVTVDVTPNGRADAVTLCTPTAPVAGEQSRERQEGQRIWQIFNRPSVVGMKRRKGVGGGAADNVAAA